MKVYQAGLKQDLCAFYHRHNAANIKHRISASQPFTFDTRKLLLIVIYINLVCILVDEQHSDGRASSMFVHRGDQQRWERKQMFYSIGGSICPSNPAVFLRLNDAKIKSWLGEGKVNSNPDAPIHTLKLLPSALWPTHFTACEFATIIN